MSSAQYALCVDGPEFAEAMARDIRAARTRVYAQTLSFEGDAAGRTLADALLDCRAPDRRVIADSITEHLINDRFLHTWSSRRDPVLQAEVRATRDMIAALRGDGVDVVLGNPIGRALHRLFVRDHKKSILIDDDVTYIGGINFSDHNFAWHDFMLRIESPEANAFFREDFLATWSGEQRCARAAFENMELFSVDGRGNHLIRTALTRLVEEAREEIFIQCPYITPPFFELLGRAADRGVRVTVILSDENNRGLLKEGILEACRRLGLRARLLAGRMTHAKALLVDNEALVLGSANFDYVSFRMQPEILGVFRDPGLIQEFKRRVLDTDLESTREATLEDVGGIRGRLAYHGTLLVGHVYALVNRLP